jgi:hypothetical protein
MEARLRLAVREKDRSGRRERFCALHSSSDVQPIAGQLGAADPDEREC